MDNLKKEMATYNGVDTTYWNNTAERIECPAGWEDHQQTQQLIRKYLSNSEVKYNIENRLLIVYVSQDEWSILAPNGRRAEHEGLYVAVTYKGCCLTKYNSRSPRQDDIRCYSYTDYAKESGNDLFIRRAVIAIKD